MAPNLGELVKGDHIWGVLALVLVLEYLAFRNKD
jgi:hypothetical protein